MTGRIPAAWRAELETCYVRCAKDVNRHVFLLARGDRELTEDVVQEAFQAAAGNWEKLRTFDATRQVARLCRTATHIAIDYFRRNETARRKQPEVLRFHYQHVERVVLEMVGQLFPVRPYGPDECPELLRQLCSPTNHRLAGVSCDNLHATTGEANRQLSGSARTVEDVSVRRQEIEDVVERRSELGWRQLCIRDEPFVHLGKHVIACHNHYLRHAADSR